MHGLHLQYPRHSSGFHFDNGVTELVDIPGKVGGDEHRRTLIPELFQKLANLGNALLVKAVHGLVDYQYGRILHYGLGYAKALAHTH